MATKKAKKTTQGLKKAKKLEATKPLRRLVRPDSHDDESPKETIS